MMNMRSRTREFSLPAHIAELRKWKRIYDGLKPESEPQPKYVFDGSGRHYYDFALKERRKTKTIFVMTPLGGRYYHPIMGGSPATYFIKNGGSDAADGLSDANAWATLSKITSGSFAAADIIQLKRASTWNESFTVPNSGSQGSPIIIQAYDSGALPRINGQTGGNQAAIKTSNKTDISFIFLEIHSPNEANSVCLWLDNDCHRCTLEDSTLVGDSTGQTKGLRLENGPGLIVQRNDVSGCSLALHIIRNAGFTEVYDGYVGYNTLHDNSDQDIENNGGMIVYNDGDWTGFLIEVNDVSGFEEDGIDVSMSNGIVQDNTIHDSGSISGESKTGLKTFNNANGVLTLRRNHIYNIESVETLHSAGLSMQTGTTTAPAIHHNLIHDITIGPGGSGLARGVTTQIDVSLYNNTVVSCDSYAIANYNGSATTQNNICDGAVYDLFIEATVTGGYNCLVNDAQRNLEGGSYSGSDLGATDPLFVDAAGADFNLQSASPCIDAGTDVGLNQDFAGISIPQGGAPDIGAYEFEQEAPSPPPSSVVILGASSTPQRSLSENTEIDEFWESYFRDIERAQNA